MGFRYGIESDPYVPVVRRIATEAILVRATESPSLFLQIAGAAGLVRKHRIGDHGKRLTELEAAWPVNLGTVMSTLAVWADHVRERRQGDASVV